MVVEGHAWLWGACVAVGGVCGCGRVCMVVGGVHGCGGMRGCGGGHAWDTTRYSQ